MFHFASKGGYYLSAAFIQARPLIKHIRYANRPQSRYNQHECPSSWTSISRTAGWLSLDVNTLSSFVSSGGVFLQCFGRCTIHDLSCSWQQYYPWQCCPFSSMATCTLIRSVEWLVGSSTMFHHTMASHPSEAGDPCHQVSRMVLWSGTKKCYEQGWWQKMGWFLWWILYTWPGATT